MKDILTTIAMPAVVLAVMVLTARGCTQEHRKRDQWVNKMLNQARVERELNR